MAVHLVAPACVVVALTECVRARLECHDSDALADVRWAEIESDLADGGSLVLIGSSHLPRLRHLWIATTPCSATQHRSASVDAPPLPPIAWGRSACRALCIRPDRVHVYFGVDAMPRAEIIPLLEAVGDDGPDCACSALWVKHTAPAMVSDRMDGSHLFIFALDEPLLAASAEEWAGVVASLADAASAPVSVVALQTAYATYRLGERVHVNVTLANRSACLRGARLEMAAVRPDGTVAHTRPLRRHLNPHERVVVPWEFDCGEADGLWRVRCRLISEDRFAYGSDRDTSGVQVDCAECGFVTAPDDPSHLARPRIEGRSFSVGSRDGFLAGTHYYPSSSWWDWAWRDFRPERAARDIDEMVRRGYSFARVWIDPELDEAALRGLEAWLYLSGARGIVSIVCVFTQWTRTLAYPEGDGMVTFDFATTTDYNVYSIQLKNVEHQRRYLSVLARRWARMPNIVWNLANEAFVVDPSEDQVDAEWFGGVEPRSGPLAGAAYFSRWADIMTETLRTAGAEQPVLRGYGFINGGDCYLQNRDGAMLLWHHYVGAEVAGPSLAFATPGTLAMPLLLEEFGVPTLDEEERLERYEGIACWAAAMGAGGACAYEWGVSWLARELPFTATPLRSSSLAANPDPRWMEGQVVYSDSWPIGSMGLCPWAASFSYGSNLPCTPYAAPAAIALGEVAQFCSDIGPPRGHELVLVVVPTEWAPFAPFQGYMRLLDPTVRTIQALAAAHVPFSVIQQDQLAAYEGPASVVVYPVTDEIDTATATVLARMESEGCAVYRGEIDAGLPTLAAHALPIESDGPVWCLRRGTRDGSLIMLFAPEGPATVRLRERSQTIELAVSRYALVELLDTGGSRVWTGRAKRASTT